MKIEDAVTGQREMVLVPRKPTKAMIEGARWAALDEDAAGVWEEMIAAYEASVSPVNVSNSSTERG